MKGHLCRDEQRNFNPRTSALVDRQSPPDWTYTQTEKLYPTDVGTLAVDVESTSFAACQRTASDMVVKLDS